MERFNAQHQQFIDEMVRNGGDHIAACIVVYKYDTRQKASIQGNRLLKMANISAAISKQRDEIKALGVLEAVKAVKKKATGQYLSMTEKRKILADIARGTLKVKIPYLNSKGQQRFMVRPPQPNERRLALELDARLMGEMAVEKREFTGKDGKDLIPTDTTQTVKLDQAGLDNLIKQMNAAPLPNSSR